ncbi:type II toxin-antitoxin system RelB family antitoxin [Corynebacterium mastitidis]|uniref:type II toxin-antitoxin system RelB family antitoxin n=1 Tax=Corynebacterium mastitidis TaxID=161890 RepID=UPI0009FD4AB1|nr:ribbon-helix-helix domain-containing protein [Corynebacterium mastitidis]
MTTSETPSQRFGAALAVRLPDDLRARVDVLAAAGRRSRSDVLREALEREIDQLEWEHRVVETAADIRSGRESTVSLAELNAQLGDPGEPDVDDLH